MGAAGSIPKSFTIPAALECIGEDTINTDQIPENVLGLFGLADSIEEGNLRRDQLLLLLAATSACESHPGILAALEDVVKSFLARAGGDASPRRRCTCAISVSCFSGRGDGVPVGSSPRPRRRGDIERGALAQLAIAVRRSETRTTRRPSTGRACSTSSTRRGRRSARRPRARHY